MNANGRMAQKTSSRPFAECTMSTMNCVFLRFLEQLRSLKTKGERKNVRSIFLILKPKYVEDYLSDKKKQWKDSATQQVLTA
jgi:hypothetical protein